MEHLNMSSSFKVFRNYRFRYTAGNCQANVSYLRPLLTGARDSNNKDCFDIAFQFALTKNLAKYLSMMKILLLRNRLRN